MPKVYYENNVFNSSILGLQAAKFRVSEFQKFKDCLTLPCEINILVCIYRGLQPGTHG